jgi:O-acetylhomoserine (thiol)-lyase
MKPATLQIHSGYSHDAQTGATAVPVFQTASYAYESAKELANVFRGRAPGHVYTRISNPTNHALEQRLTALEGGVGAIATASGMAAISAATMALLKAGDEVVAAKGIFGGTVSYFQNVLGRFGVTTHWVNANDASAFNAAVNEKTRLIFAETITNPTMEIPDLEAISGIAKTRSSTGTAPPSAGPSLTAAPLSGRAVPSKTWPRWPSGPVRWPSSPIRAT